MKKSIILFFALLVIIKILAIYSVNNKLSWSPDEERNFKIAENYLSGHGYSIYDEHTKTYKLTAFHPSFPVFTYILMQKINFNKNSFTLLIYSISIILYLVSIIYFYQLSLLFLKDSVLSKWASFIYAIYPSSIFYIGSLCLYENIVTPLLVIVLYKLIRIFFYKEKIGIKNYLVILSAVLFSSLFRPSSIPIYLLIFLILAKKNPLFILSVFIIVFLCHLPVLIKNHKMFGHYILATEQNFSLLEGHNPFAKGSWMGVQGNDFSSYLSKNIANYASLNEFEQSDANRKLAIRWVRQNPVKELKLVFKKLAIYFLPQNYDGGLIGNRWWNPINLAVHLLFFLYCISFFIKRTIPAPQEIMLIAPVAASLIFSIVMFVGYRWRYYAEPFMILTGFIFLRRLSRGWQ